MDNDNTNMQMILSLKSTLDLILNYCKSQELNLKILSNKINLLNEKLLNNPVHSSPGKATIEPADFVVQHADRQNNSKEIRISPDFNLSVDSAPQGPRRTSRQDDSDFEDYSKTNTMAEPTEHPLSQSKKVFKPIENVEKKESVNDNSNNVEFKHPKLTLAESVQVTQRVLGKSNNSLFLAEVEVRSAENDELVHRTRTNGIGKWVGTLSPGKYRVTIKKMGGAGKEVLKVSQDIQIDGIKSLVDLPELHIK